MTKNLVIVESPAKAKTIEKYLGKDYKVMSSVGHIRKDTKVDVANDFAVVYEIDPEHAKVVSELKKAAKDADAILLATDEDREGEAISWHLIEVLNLPKNTKRITFHEITEPALKSAIKSPRTVNMDMVSSQQARQTLDMLVGFDLSGVVRKKVPGAISAGRVQSPALRLVVEREREIEKFSSRFNFKVTGKFKKGSQSFDATLDKVTPDTIDGAKKLFNILKEANYIVDSVAETEADKANPVPFTTAALQIEANSRLGFSSSTTMRAAQALYQAGAITYHRTDSLNLSKLALASIAGYIEKTFGKNYLQVRHFKTKDASAQEAHEAIRPTHIEVASAGKNDYEKRLYDLIRNRTLATQMANAKVNRTTITISAQKSGKPISFSTANQLDLGELKQGSALNFIAKGEVVVFDGFLKVYGNSKDSVLPKLTNGDTVNAEEIVARQTYAKPPARYTEGSLVKKLEELGIGRPSTYASIMSAIQIRGYVVKGESEGTEREVSELILKKGQISEQTVTEKAGATKGKLIPTPVGELVSNFLLENFDKIVDYDFTAGIEKKLDEIAEAKLTRIKMLKDFYGPFSKLVVRSNGVNRYNSATELGTDPKTGLKVYAKIGKNGGFIQVGENEKETGEKPRFAPLPEGKTVKDITFEEALKQLELPQLPRNLGKAKDGVEIIAASGPFGPYIKAGPYNISLSKTEKSQDPYKITLKTAEALYEKKKASIIADWGDYKIIIGPFGPYIKGPAIKPLTGRGRPRPNNAKIPKDVDPKKLTLDEAKKILEEKPKSTSRHPKHSKTKKSKK